MQVCYMALKATDHSVTNGNVFTLYRCYAGFLECSLIFSYFAFIPHLYHVYYYLSSTYFVLSTGYKLIHVHVYVYMKYFIMNVKIRLTKSFCYKFWLNCPVASSYHFYFMVYYLMLQYQTRLQNNYLYFNITLFLLVFKISLMSTNFIIL